ncbi:MarR family transcriptional regulator [Phenylobacterium sp.]|uniref:HVO_A0114 family putative DNA-binding protein n=1 Tax=Phenylobacterium sp. TaxID=1871053 RepID=UPI0025FDE008|nr:MarR family transcriptional regulator [Phenylobacterium sp.]MBX3484797.1 MarR family transcriptional regulator [Phenylobacterium sp.]
MPEPKPKVQSWTAFKNDLLTAAKGAPAPADAGSLVVESVDALMRLLTPENRELLRIIRDEKPQSVAALARRTHRAEPNLARTLGKLEAAGLVAFRQDGRRRAPITLARRFSVHVDPFSTNDRIEVA